MQEMSLPEQQEYVTQMSLLNKKLVHLEETLKIEEEGKLLKKKIEFHQANSAKEAQLAARKKDEQNAQLRQIEEEEGTRRSVMNRMVMQTDNSLSPIKDVLLHFEGRQASRQAVIIKYNFYLLIP